MSWQFSAPAKNIREALYRQFVMKGRSGNLQWLVGETGLSRRDVMAGLRELERGVMIMLVPHTHDVAKCPPWSNLPTDHLVEFEGECIGYAGCSLESINMSYCFPGRTITIRTCCAQTGDPICMVWKDGAMLRHDPQSALLYVGTDPRLWDSDWFRACAHNVFFASRAAKEAWEAEHPGTEGQAVDFAALPALATYTTERRFDFERGADGDPAALLAMLRDAGLALPAHWATTIEPSPSHEGNRPFVS